LLPFRCVGIIGYSLFIYSIILVNTDRYLSAIVIGTCCPLKWALFFLRIDEVDCRTNDFTWCLFDVNWCM